MIKKIVFTLNKLRTFSSKGHGLVNKIKIPLYYTLLSIRRWVGVVPSFKTHKKITLDSNGQEVDFYLKNQLDFDVVWDAFIEDQYEIDHNIEIKTILDLGSNVGATVLRYNNLYPNAHIFAFEPDPRNIKSLEKNMRNFRNKVTFSNNAISGKDGENIEFHLGTDHHWSSSLLDRESTGEVVSVSTVSLNKVIEDHNIKDIDILKFDIEGAEYDAFKNFKGLERVKYIVGEVHPTILPCSLKEFMDLFSGFETLSYDDNTGVFKLRNKNIDAN